MIEINLAKPKLDMGSVPRDLSLVDWRPFNKTSTSKGLPDFCIVVHRWKANSSGKARYIPLISLRDRIVGGPRGRME